VASEQNKWTMRRFWMVAAVLLFFLIGLLVFCLLHPMRARAPLILLSLIALPLSLAFMSARMRAYKMLERMKKKDLPKDKLSNCS
jgi:TM2 domain-containing membrane protein YozV